MTPVFQNAQWIMADTQDPTKEHQFYLYRDTFSVVDAKNITLHISAFSQYAVWINGVFANAGVFEDYDFHPVYDSLDITSLCHAGENELLIGQYVCGANFSTRSKGTPGVIYALYQDESLVTVSRTEVMSAHDPRYLDTHERLSYQLGFNAEFDARVSFPQLCASILVDKPLPTPRPIEKLTIEETKCAERLTAGLFHENDPALPKAERMQTAYLAHIPPVYNDKTAHIPEGQAADGMYFLYDLGGETTGYLSFSVTVPEDTEILVGYGEHIRQLRVSSHIASRNFCFRFMAKKGENTFFYPYQRIGARYLQFHVYSKEALLERVGVRPTMYPLTIKPCSRSDKLHQRIYAVGVNTLRLCMHEHYEDCPWREQALYGLDSRIQMLCGYYAFGEYRFPRASLALMARSFRTRDGLIELCSPGIVSITIPSFTAVFVRAVYEYQLHSGDTTLTQEYFETLHAIADGFVSRIDPETGLIPLYTGKEHWNFYEWRDGLEGNERFSEEELHYEAPLCAFVADALDCFSALCQAEHPELVEHYQNLAKKLKMSTHAHFFDAAHNAYRTRLTDAKPRHELTQALMLYTGSVPAEHEAAVEEVLASDTLIPVSLSMSIFYYDAFLMRGHRKEEILNRIEERWGRMLDSGADTFWETDRGAGDFGEAGSLCHGWSAVPVYIFEKYYAD